MTGFTHPLARDAKVWPSGGMGGAAQRLLVVITTLELDPSHPRFKKKQAERLTAAARAWIADNPDAASDYLLMNRPKTWAGDKSA